MYHVVVPTLAVSVMHGGEGFNCGMFICRHNEIDILGSSCLSYACLLVECNIVVNVKMQFLIILKTAKYRANRTSILASYMWVNSELDSYGSSGTHLGHLVQFSTQPDF